jgi:hypothetical protein
VGCWCPLALSREYGLSIHRAGIGSTRLRHGHGKCRRSEEDESSQLAGEHDDDDDIKEGKNMV